MTEHPPPVFATYQDVRRYLATVTDYEKMLRYTMKRGAFDLGRVERFFEALDTPQASYECIHIAGTKGKGSTTMMLDAIARAHGVHSGRYTSPHLERETERVAIGGHEISEEELTVAFRELAPALARFQHSGDALTWFEIFTGAALCAFRRAGVALAVLETGLGGRLDATNVVMPAVTVITNIGHDHHDKLGDTLEDVAYEKAGIVKPGVPLVTGQYDRGALDVVLARARELGAPAKRLRTDFDATNVQPAPDGITFDLHGTGFRYRKLAAPVLGAFQASNAAIAVEAWHAAARAGAVPMPEEEAVREAFASLALPGRCELFAAGGGLPRVLIDVAHNEESVHQTVKTIAARFPGVKAVMVVGIAKDKNHERCIEELADLRAPVIFTEYPSVRASKAADLLAVWMKYGGAAGVAEADWDKAFEAACKMAGPDGLVVVTGSFYLAGMLRGKVSGG